MSVYKKLEKIAKVFLDKIFIGEKEKISRYVLRYALLILISVLVFSLISILIPFSEKSTLWWISQTNDISGILAFFSKFYVVSLSIFIAPFLLLIGLFSLTLFVAFFLLKSEITIRKVASITFPSYLPFLVLFWIPIVSWVMLAVVLVLLIYKSGKMFSLKKSVFAYVLGLIFFLAILAAGLLSIYSVSNFDFAKPTRGGDLYIVGKTDENIFGIHGVTHDYESFYDENLAKNNLEIYMPISYYDTEPISEVVLISYANMQTLKGRLIPESMEFDGSLLSKSFPPKLSDIGNPPTRVYYRCYSLGKETCIVYFPFWEKQRFPRHPGDMLPVVIWMRNNEPTKLLLGARSARTSKITLLRRGLSNLKRGQSMEKVFTPFFHGYRIYYCGRDETVMKYINPIEYVNSEIELPVKIISVAPNHVFELYTNQVDAIKVEPEFIPLNENTFLELKSENPILARYDTSDPFAEPYVYTTYPHMEPLWPRKVPENEKFDNIYLSPLWAG